MTSKTVFDVICKAKATEKAMFYGDMVGATAIVELLPNQKWLARKKGGYYFVYRKGDRGISIRLTPSAFSKLFEMAEVQNDRV